MPAITIQPYDPGSTEIRSALIAACTQAAFVLSQALNMNTVAETGVVLGEVTYSGERPRGMIYQADVSQKLWLASPAPVIRKNGSVITPVTGHFTINLFAGELLFEENYVPLVTDIITADFTRLTSTSETILSMLNDIANIANYALKYKGFFAESADLISAFPLGDSGEFATVGETNSIWQWSSKYTSWVNTKASIDMSSFYTKTQADDKFEPKITPEGIASGNDSYYFSGAKSFIDLPARIRSTLLTGLLTEDTAVITASSSVIEAFGKLQSQITANAGLATVSAPGRISAEDKRRIELASKIWLTNYAGNNYSTDFGFVIDSGSIAAIQFGAANANANPTLNTVPLLINGSNIPANYINANSIAIAYYNGTSYNIATPIINYASAATSLSFGSAGSAGTSLNAARGDHTHGMPEASSGPPGTPGKSIEYNWNGTQLGVRVQGEPNYTYTDLKGSTGPAGTPPTPISGSSAPTTSTAGVLAQLYYTTGTPIRVFLCTKATSPYTWVEATGMPVLSGTANPSTSTAGLLGQIYINTSANSIFICTKATSPYTWVNVSAGGLPVYTSSTVAATTNKVLTPTPNFASGDAFILVMSAKNTAAAPQIQRTSSAYAPVQFEGAALTAAEQLPLVGIYRYDGTNMQLMNAVPVIPPAVTSLPASSITAGTFVSGVNLPAAQLTAGMLPSGVNVPAANIQSGTLAVGVVAATGTDYTTARIRNIELATSAGLPSGNGSIRLVYA